MAAPTSKTVRLSDLSGTDQIIVQEYYSLVQELFSVTPKDSSCEILKEEVLSFLEMYKSVFGEGKGIWTIGRSEALDPNLLQFRAPYRKMFQENPYICIYKFPPAPKSPFDEVTMTRNVTFDKRISIEYNWIFRINVIKRETFLKRLKSKAVEEFQENLVGSFLPLINGLEVMFEENEFLKLYHDIHNASIQKFKSQISNDKEIYSMGFLESELKKEITSRNLNEEIQRKFSEATQNAVERASNILKTCTKQCNDKAPGFIDDVEVILSINGIPEIYKSRLQEKLTNVVHELFEEIEAHSIVNYENRKKLLALLNARENIVESSKLGNVPDKKELHGKPILKTLPPVPNRDEITTKPVDKTLSSKTEVRSKNPETTLTMQPVSTNISSLTKLPFDTAKHGFNFGPQIQPSSGIMGTSTEPFTFNKNLNFTPVQHNYFRQHTNNLGPLATNFSTLAVRKPEEEKQHEKPNGQLVFSLPEAPGTSFERDLPPLCIHLQDSQIQMGMMIDGQVLALKDEFGNSEIPAVVAYSKLGQFLWGSQVDTNDTFHFLKHVWCLLKPGQLDHTLIADEVSFQGKLIKISFEFLLAFILRKLKLQVEREQKGICKKAVIVVPLHFTSTRRVQVKHSAEIAGFSENGLVDEPSAISYAYSAEHNYGGYLMVLCEHSNKIFAIPIYITRSKNDSDPNLFDTLSCFQTGWHDEATTPSEILELEVQKVCLEASGLFVSCFPWKVCITCKSNSKWLLILEKVAKEFGKGEVSIYNSAISGAALLESDSGKHRFISRPSVYDILVVSGKTATTKRVTKRQFWFKDIVIDGNHASLYQLDIDNRRIPVLSFSVENNTNNKVVDFWVEISKEGITTAKYIAKRSLLTDKSDKVYVDEKDIIISTSSISGEDVLKYKAQLSDLFAELNQIK